MREKSKKDIFLFIRGCAVTGQRRTHLGFNSGSGLQTLPSNQKHTGERHALCLLCLPSEQIQVHA